MDLNAAVQDTMEFLGRVRKLRNGIENKMLRIETLRDMATSTTAAVSDMPRSDSPNLQRMETVLCKVADLEKEIAQDRAAMETAKAEITAALSELEDYREQQALYGRFVECNGWAAIAKDCGFCIRTVQRWLDSGIEQLAVLMEGRLAHGQKQAGV